MNFQTYILCMETLNESASDSVLDIIAEKILNANKRYISIEEIKEIKHYLSPEDLSKLEDLLLKHGAIVTDGKYVKKIVKHLLSLNKKIDAAELFDGINEIMGHIKPDIDGIVKRYVSPVSRELSRQGINVEKE